MMFSSSILFAVPLMVILTVLQTSVLPYFPLLGVTPSLPFIMALAWGLIRGANEGIIWAFIAGFFMDLFTAAPTGGFALTYMIAVMAAYVVKDLLPANRTVVPMLLAGLASILQQLLYALYLGIFGYGVGQVLASSLLPTILLQTFLILPIYWLLYLVQSIVWPKPVEV